MEEISELIKIITTHTKKNLPLIDLKAQEDQDNKELKLFLGVKNGEYDTDQAASKGIYGEDEVDFKFRMLKSRLNKKLLNHLFFMDFTLSKKHKSASFHQECLDQLHISKLLLKIGEVKHATKLLYKTFDLAKECEYTDILLQCLYELRDIYTITYRPKLYQNIKEEIKEYKQLQEKEEKAYTIYFDQKLVLNSSLTNRKKDLSPLKKAIAALDKLNQEARSYNIFEKHLKLSIWLKEQEGDFEGSIKLTDLVEKEFDKGKINQTRFNPEILWVSRLYAMLKLNKIDSAIKLADSYLKEVEVESSTWYAIKEHQFLLQIRKHEFDEAMSILLSVINAKNFSDLEESIMEKWNIFRAYLFYFTGDRSLNKKFNYNELVSEIPEFEKEKAGLNLARLILQLIAQIDGDLKDLHVIINAIEEYSNKYLNNSFSKRTKIFCKLLNKVVAHNRDFDSVLQKSKYLSDKLEESEIEGDVYADIEIVPYEYLWEVIIQRLSILRYQNV